MAATVNVNGRVSGERDAVISVFDHGFPYGEAFYETRICSAPTRHS
jgi:branched-subunit amino acid aminotransferase/4-amino-4-deoxychorismate lyase